MAIANDKDGDQTLRDLSSLNFYHISLISQLKRQINDLEKRIQNSKCEKKTEPTEPSNIIVENLQSQNSRLTQKLLDCEQKLQKFDDIIKNKDLEIAYLLNNSLFAKIVFINNFVTNSLISKISKNKHTDVIDFEKSLLLKQNNIEKMFDTNKKRSDYMSKISDLYSVILFDDVYKTKESILYGFCDVNNYSLDEFVNAIFYITLSFSTRLASS